MTLDDWLEAGEPVEKAGVFVPFGQVAGDNARVGSFEGFTFRLGRGTLNGEVRYWNPLNAPAWGAGPSHERPGPLVAAILTFPLDASPLMSRSCARRARLRIAPRCRAVIRTGQVLESSGLVLKGRRASRTVMTRAAAP